MIVADDDAVVGRFVCVACRVELRPVRIGWWRCPARDRVGALDREHGPFTVLRIVGPRCARAEQMETRDLLDHARPVPGFAGMP